MTKEEKIKLIWEKQVEWWISDGYTN
jgi:hypothetical protein